MAETATSMYREMDGDRARRKGWGEGKAGGQGGGERERERGEEQREEKYTAAIQPLDADLFSFYTMKDKAARRSLCTPPLCARRSLCTPLSVHAALCACRRLRRLIGERGDRGRRNGGDGGGALTGWAMQSWYGHIVRQAA